MKIQIKKEIEKLGEINNINVLPEKLKEMSSVLLMGQKAT